MFGGLSCPTCGNKSHSVVDTRKYLGVIMRRRHCGNGHTFVSKEVICSDELYKQYEREKSESRRAAKKELIHV